MGIEAGILAELLERNRLRRANGLPALDLREEYQQELTARRYAEFRRAMDEFAHLRPILSERWDRRAIRQGRIPRWPSCGPRYCLCRDHHIEAVLARLVMRRSGLRVAPVPRRAGLTMLKTARYDTIPDCFRD